MPKLKMTGKQTAEDRAYWNSVAGKNPGWKPGDKPPVNTEQIVANLDAARAKYMAAYYAANGKPSAPQPQTQVEHVPPGLAEFYYTPAGREIYAKLPQFAKPQPIVGPYAAGGPPPPAAPILAGADVEALLTTAERMEGWQVQARRLANYEYEQYLLQRRREAARTVAGDTAVQILLRRWVARYPSRRQWCQTLDITERTLASWIGTGRRRAQPRVDMVNHLLHYIQGRVEAGVKPGDLDYFTPPEVAEFLLATGMYNVVPGNERMGPVLPKGVQTKNQLLQAKAGKRIAGSTRIMTPQALEAGREALRWVLQNTDGHLSTLSNFCRINRRTLARYLATEDYVPYRTTFRALAGWLQEESGVLTGAQLQIAQNHVVALANLATMRRPGAAERSVQRKLGRAVRKMTAAK